MILSAILFLTLMSVILGQLYRTGNTSIYFVYLLDKLNCGWGCCFCNIGLRINIAQQGKNVWGAGCPEKRCPSVKWPNIERNGFKFGTNQIRTSFLVDNLFRVILSFFLKKNPARNNPKPPSHHHHPLSFVSYDHYFFEPLFSSPK